jgi:hypothetical protein
VGLPEGDPAVLAVGLGGAERDEEGIAVALELGPLVREVGVLDGQVVQPELRLDLLEQRLVRLVETDPHEAVLMLEDLGDVGQGQLAETAALGVGRAGDDRAGLVALHPGPLSPP